jgi:hypothetical protein
MTTITVMVIIGNPEVENSGIGLVVEDCATVK